MPRDYSDAPPPSFDLIPDGTVATVSINIRAGGVGEDGMLKRSQNGECEMLDLEFIVLNGEYKGRRFWTNLILEGTTEGQKSMASGSPAVLKAILDSALGLHPDDKSPEARAARTVSVKTFQGMSFIAMIGVEKGGPKKDGGTWPDKNRLVGVITKDKKEWHPIEQPPPFDGGGGAAPSSAAPAAPVERPSWAQ